MKNTSYAFKMVQWKERTGVFSIVEFRDSPRAIRSNVIFNSEFLCVPQRSPPPTVCELRWEAQSKWRMRVILKCGTK